MKANSKQRENSASMARDKHLLPLLGRKSESHSTREGIRDKIPWREFFQIKEAVSQIFKALSAEHIYIEIGKKKYLFLNR